MLTSNRKSFLLQIIYISDKIPVLNLITIFRKVTTLSYIQSCWGAVFLRWTWTTVMTGLQWWTPCSEFCSGGCCQHR